MTALPSTPAEWQSDPDIQRIQKRTVRVLILSQIIGGVGVGAAASMGSLLAESITNSESLAGIARTSSTLGAAVVGLPLALLAIRRGRRGALSLGWAVAALGGIVLVVAAVTSSVVLLVLGMLMFGSGSATNLQSRYAAADLAAPSHRARALSMVVWSTTIGSVLGPNLAGPGAVVARSLSIPSLSGAFVIASVALVIAAIVMAILLRPDPLLEARSRDAAAVAAETGRELEAREPHNLRAILALIAKTPAARFAFVVVILGHTVMGAVMTMTPVHMSMHGASLSLVGLTISAHVLGMFAFSPFVGALADRWGRVQTIVAGQGLFVLSAIFAGLSGGSVVLVTIGLFLLGLGWSFSLVAGSAMLSDSVPTSIRPAVQGTADTSMNIVSAIAAGLSGPILMGWGFGGLNIVAAVLVIPVLLLLPTMRGKRRGDGAVETPDPELIPSDTV
ncbi:MAG: MFS transporter [Antricoccus sp.]